MTAERNVTDPPLRVLFAGTPEVALPSLRALMADERVEVVGVLTNPDRARGRSAALQRSAVAEHAHAGGLPLLQPERPIEALDDIRALRADVGAVVAYGALLPPAVLEALPLGLVNLHFSLLPRWRGAAPVQHAIAARDARTGVSVFRLDSGMDTGPLLRQESVDLAPDMDAGDLLMELAERGSPLLVEALLALAAGEEPTPQDESGATVAPKLTAQDAAVDWHLPAEVVAARIRSVSPRPGAATSLHGRRIKVGGPTALTDARLGVTRSEHIGPGGILSVDEGLLVACGEGAVRLARLQPEGKRWLTSEEFINGHRVTVGQHFGT
jgi:methionyl-tRNA formyltransferase